VQAAAGAEEDVEIESIERWTEKRYSGQCLSQCLSLLLHCGFGIILPAEGSAMWLPTVLTLSSSPAFPLASTVTGLAETLL
jgi:hypothetical protein